MVTNPLTELIPPTARKYVYGLAVLAALVLATWQASQGDWAVFTGALLAALVPALAASNTPASKPEIEEAAVDLLEDEDADQYLDGHAEA